MKTVNDEIYEKVAKELGIDIELVKKVVNYQFDYTLKKVEFLENIRLPYFGVFHPKVSDRKKYNLDVILEEVKNGLTYKEATIKINGEFKPKKSGGIQTLSSPIVEECGETTSSEL